MGAHTKTPTEAGDRTQTAVSHSGMSARTRLAAPAVVLAILVSAIGLGVIAENGVQGQAKELLGERASEISAILSVSVSDARSNLRVSALAASSGHDQQTFTSIAGEAALAGTTTVVLRDRGAGLVTIASAGPLAAADGAPVDPLLSTLVTRARSSTDMIGEIIERAGAKHVVLALALPGDTRLVAYTDTPLRPATPAPSTAGSPYRELNVAVYAASTPNRNRLVLVSGTVPATASGHAGDVVERPLTVGTDRWIIRVSARHPLVGPVAVFFPKLIVGTGVALALFVGLLVSLLARRRAYALRLVAERTESLREAQESAEHANDAKSEFLSRMSHELRTPLNAVMGFAQLLEMDQLTDDQRENVEQIGRGGTHLLDLINEILDISRIESGTMAFNIEPVSIREVIGAATRLVGPLAEERTVHLLAGNDQDPDWHVLADRQRLKQILLNLLSNGIKYNHEGGSVWISCTVALPGRLRIQISDTGPGIPAEKRDLLFVPFERLGAEHTAVEGTGVGLALSRRLAEAMNCQLSFESSSSRGSTFWVELPLVELPTGVVRRNLVAETRRRRHREPIRVLHIEDNPANIALVERVLAQRPEVSLITAAQGLAGLELARQHRPALILLDLSLSDVPGEEILVRLNEDPVTTDIPVVVLSADAMPWHVQLVLDSGAAGYLTKPIDLRQLLAVIDDIVARGRTHLIPGGA